MASRISGLAVVLLLGCGSSDNPATPAPAQDAAVDTAKPDTGPAYVSDGRPISPLIKCGPGPYVDFSLTPYSRIIGELSKRQINEPVKVSMSACPEVKAETDAEGYADYKVTIGQPISFKFEGTGLLPTRLFEMTPQSYTRAPAAYVFTNEAMLPGYGADKGVIFVDVAAAAKGTCVSEDEVTLTVDGHPDAVVTYYSASKPFAPVTGATATTGSGMASIAGVPVGSKVTIKGAKTGCDVALLAAPGTVTVEAGTITHAAMLVRDPLPSCGAPPWVLLEGTVTTRMVNGTAGPAVADVKMDWSACPGVTTTTDVDGKFKAWVSQYLPVARRYEKTGYLITHTTEQAWPQDYSTASLALREEATWTPLMPGYDKTHAIATIGVSAPNSGPCAGGANVSIKVNGHPDAKVHYLDYLDGQPPKPTTGTVTTKRGLVLISGLTPGELNDAALTATREGCTYSLKGGIDSGKAKLEAGGFTIATLYGSVAK